MVSPLEAQGGVLDGASLAPVAGCSVIRCLFRERLGGGGGGFGSPPWGSCCRATCRVPGINRLTVNAHIVTISVPELDLAPEECTDSAVVDSTNCTRALGSLTGTWTLRLRDTSSADSSLTGARSSTVIYLGPKSQASSIVREGGRKLACQVSMYDSNGLSTNRAGLKGC